MTKRKLKKRINQLSLTEENDIMSPGGRKNENQRGSDRKKH